jgi:hypothetical protein
VASAGAWKLEIGEGANPAEWKEIGSGSGNIDGVLGTITTADMKDGVYTVRLSTQDALGLSTSVTINYKKGAIDPSKTPGAGGTPGGTPSGTPSPGVTRPPTLNATPTPED